MEIEKIKITKEEYEKLIKLRNVDQELLKDIARGIKDILQGRVREV